jgi:group I intron endonuclease
MPAAKNDVLLEGINWCLNKTDQHETILKAKYKKGQPCTIKNQKADPDKGNIYAGGNALIGFLNEIQFSWVKEKWLLDEKVYAEIVKVSDMEQYPNIEVTIRMQTSPFVKKAATNTKYKAPSSIALPIAIKKPRSGKIKHPITNKAFLAQKDLGSVCRNLSGRTGIYCIYTKEFTTYIGQSKDIGIRLRSHINDLKSGRHKNTKMQSDWNMHGASYFAFQQVEQCYLSELDERELYYIQKYKTFEYGYNATEDGQGKFDQREIITSGVDGQDENLNKHENVLDVINNYFKEAIEYNTDNTLAPQDKCIKVSPVTVVNQPVVIQNETVTVQRSTSPQNKIQQTLSKQPRKATGAIIEVRQKQKQSSTYISTIQLWESNNKALFKELEAEGMLIVKQAGAWKVRCSLLLKKVFGHESASYLILYNQTRKLKIKLDNSNNELLNDNIVKINNLIKQIKTRLS